MTAPTIPDLLRRFVATPHSHVAWTPGGSILVESNDSDFARDLALRLAQRAGSTRWQRLGHIKIVIDTSVTSDGETLGSLGCGPLRVVLRGTNTILFRDSGTREMLAFLAPEVTVAEFMERLLPLALAMDGLDEYCGMHSRELQTDDMDSIAP